MVHQWAKKQRSYIPNIYDVYRDIGKFQTAINQKILISPNLFLYRRFLNVGIHRFLKEKRGSLSRIVPLLVYNYYNSILI